MKTNGNGGPRTEQHIGWRSRPDDRMQPDTILVADTLDNRHDRASVNLRSVTLCTARFAA
jgi:hypothetical protein